MRLAPRHYLLLFVLLGLAVYNGMRLYRGHHREVGPTVVVNVDRVSSPPWSAFDKAAALRDAPDAQFSPALTALSASLDDSTAVAASPATTPADTVALKGCRTWLLFYRQAVLHPATRGTFSREGTASHVDSCVTAHADLSQ